MFISAAVHKNLRCVPVTSVLTAAHLSTLVATASECSVTTEVILFSSSNFWYNPYIQLNSIYFVFGRSKGGCKPTGYRTCQYIGIQVCTIGYEKTN